MSDQGTNFSLEAFYEDAAARIRYIMYEGEPWYSVVDVVGLLTDAPTPRMYWADMKRTIQDEGFRELLEKIQQLKMEAPDGKQRLTDAANEETLLRIIQSIPSPRAEPFKQWLAQVGHERLEEARNPELAADRMRQQYRALGYPEDWIRLRLQGIITRDELTQEWRERGAQEGRQFAALTDAIQQGTFEVTVAEHKSIKSLKKADNLRDSMTGIELALTQLAEETAKAMHQERDSQGFKALKHDATEAGAVGGAARRDIEERLGHSIVSPENYKTLTAPPNLWDTPRQIDTPGTDQADNNEPDK